MKNCENMINEGLAERFDAIRALKFIIQWKIYEFVCVYIILSQLYNVNIIVFLNSSSVRPTSVNFNIHKRGKGSVGEV